MEFERFKILRHPTGFPAGGTLIELEPSLSHLLQFAEEARGYRASFDSRLSLRISRIIAAIFLFLLIRSGGEL